MLRSGRRNEPVSAHDHQQLLAIRRSADIDDFPVVPEVLRTHIKIWHDQCPGRRLMWIAERTDGALGRMHPFAGRQIPHTPSME
ncbi:hypothetical protein WT09_22290 [Burkholderia stagnalis]|nr:hypothetical protein WT09_22290 [Burkholderia stagnalis]KVN38818.1 hypothetical protein WT11_03590 [Burkholderia stagnalis]KWH46046.1 hypothetical protein WT61_27235 [Burkholderia stagnalis]KWH55661.1 hypothetical protein WT62_03105 [Burkholderia stagnalis]KWI43072.1 hypothetical protein WT71_27715 [Burkholderia stagnalis]